MREYTKLEEHPDSLSSNGESVPGTVTAPTVYSPTIRGGGTSQDSICPYSSRTPPSGSQRNASWHVPPFPPPTCPR